MTVITGMSTEEVEKKYKDPESSTSSFRCRSEACNARIWLTGSFGWHNDKLIECPSCKRLHVHPYLREGDIK